jgi:16S rRNA (cytidine1402-2'-O)-methyltransferase
VVATPIGNLGDVTLRALEVLRDSDAIFAEDTRVSRILLARHGISAPLVSAHAHNESAKRSELLRRLGRGEKVALVTDAGTPGVADPGARLVAAAAEAGFVVVAVPGASAVAAALAISGFSADRYTFGGFLPARAAARRRVLAELLERKEPIVFYEAPHRVREALGDLAELAPGRPLAACRELTKAHEEVLRGTPAEVLEAVTDERERGEWTLVLGPAPSAAERARASSHGAALDFERVQKESGVGDEEAKRRAEFLFGKSKPRRPGPTS